ncbi:Septum formation protein Maf [hydrothermal vent metagenome]|uniref:Septum formation protein Maf n=1 Tax=hydrothermal vent metagenome TaxID=652676 RepID=A0A3B0VRP3_9ZZZZ
MGIHFILASQSPRRRELIQLLGYPFEVMVADVDETSVTEPNPAVNVVQTAQLKATEIIDQLTDSLLPTNSIIIAADTTVAFAGEMLNKPADEAEARLMLQRLRNKQHKVHTGMVLLELESGYLWQGVSTAVVTMRNYSDAEIEAYVASGDPLDKAGAYAIQHPHFRPVAHLDGCYCCVMGLPVCDLIVALSRFNVPPPADLTAVSQAHLHYPCPTLASLII